MVSALFEFSRLVESKVAALAERRRLDQVEAGKLAPSSFSDIESLASKALAATHSGFSGVLRARKIGSKLAEALGVAAGGTDGEMRACYRIHLLASAAGQMELASECLARGFDAARRAASRGSLGIPALDLVAGALRTGWMEGERAEERRQMVLELGKALDGLDRHPEEQRRWEFMRERLSGSPGRRRGLSA